MQGKEKYEALEAEIMSFEAADVITTSISGGNTNTPGMDG